MKPAASERKSGKTRPGSEEYEDKQLVQREAKTSLPACFVETATIIVAQAVSQTQSRIRILLSQFQIAYTLIAEMHPHRLFAKLKVNARSARYREVRRT